MLINYLPQKQINYDQVKKYLDISSSHNQWTNSGPIKRELENYLCDLFGLFSDKTVLCVSSGTSALHTLLLFYQFYGKTKFLTSSFNFPSAKCHTGDLNINITDIDLETYTIPIEQITKNSFYQGFIIPTLFGTIPSNLQQIINFCAENELILILDNCSSPMSRFKNVNICNLPNTVCFGSFHSTKYLGAGEGGFLVCDKKDYDLLNSLTNFGFKNSRRYHPCSSNFKMSEIAAAFILSHIQNYSINKHTQIQQTIHEQLKNIEGIEVFNYKNNDEVLGNLPILFKNAIRPDVFRDIGIETNKYYYPLDDNHKNSWDIYNRILNFGLNENLTSYQIEFLVKQIKNHAQRKL